MFFRLLYLDWIQRGTDKDFRDVCSEIRTGVTLREIRLFTDVSIRTPMRYARDLRDCGTVHELRFYAEEQVFVSDFSNRTHSVPQNTVCANTHMRRLYRTTLLMIHWLDSGRQLYFYEGPRQIVFLKRMRIWKNGTGSTSPVTGCPTEPCSAICRWCEMHCERTKKLKPTIVWKGLGVR
jgi:hypothetical protein